MQKSNLSPVHVGGKARVWRGPAVPSCGPSPTLDGVLGPLPPQVVGQGELKQSAENESRASSHPNVYGLQCK